MTQRLSVIPARWRNSLTACCSRRIHQRKQRPLRNLDPEEWAILRRVIDLIQYNAKGTELGPVLETIENALRPDQAKMIQAELE